MIKPFIRWAGGKQGQIKEILKYIPKNYNCYYEPFLGAGSVFFAIEHKPALISDINGELINCYKKIKEDYKSINTLVKKLAANNSKEYYYIIRQQFNKHQGKETLTQAARFIYLMQASYNGVYRINQNGLYNVPFGKENISISTIGNLKEISLKLQKADIINCDYKQILEFARKDDFIYLDPPYQTELLSKQFQLYTREKFLHQQQDELKTFADQLDKKGCKVLISNSNIPYIKNLYKDKGNWNCLDIPTRRYISCKSNRLEVNELLIRNYYE